GATQIVGVVRQDRGPYHDEDREQQLPGRGPLHLARGTNSRQEGEEEEDANGHPEDPGVPVPCPAKRSVPPRPEEGEYQRQRREHHRNRGGKTSNRAALRRGCRANRFERIGDGGGWPLEDQRLPVFVVGAQDRGELRPISLQRVGGRPIASARLI